MNESRKTNQQLLVEIEELEARLSVAQQRLQEADERMQAQMTEFKRTEQVLEERLKFEALLAETVGALCQPALRPDRQRN